MCLMVSKLFSSEYVEADFSSDRKYERFAVGAHVLINTQNVVISRCCFAEDGYEMYQVLLCTCRAIVLLIKSFVLPRSRCRCRRGLLKLPVVLQRTAVKYTKFCNACAEPLFCSLNLLFYHVVVAVGEEKLLPLHRFLSPIDHRTNMTVQRF